jgi:hypothetical protein
MGRELHIEHGGLDPGMPHQMLEGGLMLALFARGAVTCRLLFSRNSKFRERIKSRRCRSPEERGDLVGAEFVSMRQLICSVRGGATRRRN